jgi:small GTP-binding protein
MFVFGGLSETENDGLNDLWMIGDDHIFGESKSRADLPNEIWTMILRNLDNEDIPATSVVSKSFLQLIKSDEKLTRVLNDRIGFLNIEVLPINKEIYIALVGDTRVGKSASIIQFCAGIFVEIHNPTLEENWRKQFSINGNTYLLDALDTGPELPQDITRKWYQNSHAFYAVYDITRPETLTNLTEHLKVVQEVIQKSTFPLIIVGNKADLEEQRMVSQQEGQEFAKKHGALWAETSAKMREVAFETLLEHVVELELRQRKAGGKNLSKSNKKDRCSVM